MTAGGQIGLGEMDGASLVVPIYDLPSGGAIEVHYGTSGGAAAATGKSRKIVSLPLRLRDRPMAIS